jgi:hypothetical protein
VNGQQYNQPEPSKFEVMNNHFEDELFRLIDSALDQAERVLEATRLQADF